MSTSTVHGWIQIVSIPTGDYPEWVRSAFLTLRLPYSYELTDGYRVRRDIIFKVLSPSRGDVCEFLKKDDIKRVSEFTNRGEMVDVIIFEHSCTQIIDPPTLTEHAA